MATKLFSFLTLQANFTDLKFKPFHLLETITTLRFLYSCCSTHCYGQIQRYVLPDCHFMLLSLDEEMNYKNDFLCNGLETDFGDCLVLQSEFNVFNLHLNQSLLLKYPQVSKSCFNYLLSFLINWR